MEWTKTQAPKEQKDVYTKKARWYTENLIVGEFFRMQKLGKHELSQGSRASLLEMNIGKDG